MPVRLQEPLAHGACLALLAVLVLGPLLVPAGELYASGSEGVARALAALSASGPWWLLVRSGCLALAVTAGAVVLGVPFGTLVARFDLPARSALMLVHAAPLDLRAPLDAGEL
ncbi:MAG: hypothetical protein AAB295_01015, partial [Chloroflexota bacterium]